MCTLYSVTSPLDAIAAFGKSVKHEVGNLQPMTGVYPDYAAPIVRNSATGREMVMVRWGLPTPPEHLIGASGKPKRVDSGVVNVRRPFIPHWSRWMGVEHRCVVPFNSFAEPDQVGGGISPVWFAFNDARPLAFFAGIYVPQWTSTRKLAEGEVTIDLFGFLTTDANSEVGAVHKKAMPAILTSEGQIEQWMTAPTREALKLQRPLPDGSLKIVARGTKQDLMAA